MIEIHSYIVPEVSFAEEDYTFLESVGQGEACLVMNCEAAQLVSVSVTAREITPVDAMASTGMYMNYS